VFCPSCHEQHMLAAAGCAGLGIHARTAGIQVRIATDLRVLVRSFWGRAPDSSTPACTEWHALEVAVRCGGLQ
jgi:hypothetical protein